MQENMQNIIQILFYSLVLIGQSPNYPSLYSSGLPIQSQFMSPSLPLRPSGNG